MKHIFLSLVAMLAMATAFAQAPQGFTYQAAVRNNDGSAVANRQISVRISLVQGTAYGAEQYAEMHHPTTDGGGLFTIVVGQGTALVNGTLESCTDWGNGPWFLRSQVDPAGGSNFTLSTTQQLMSVPYALYAAEAGNAGGVNVRDSVVVHVRDSVVVHVRDSVVVHIVDSVIVHNRYSVIYDTFALHPYDRSPADVEGTLPGVFSISAANRIAFSRGNLQYKASTGTWRFALHQEDIVGTANAYISATDTNWIDLFGYGTSGYNGKNPYNSNSTFSNYMSATIANSRYDWGVYNAISNGGNRAGIWRTLSQSEWEYILSGRANATSLRARAMVNGIPGLILFPDGWTAISGININTSASNYSINNINNSQWVQLESAGAVFLPAAGYRYVININNVGQYGRYWTSTLSSTNVAYEVYYHTAGVGVTGEETYSGCAVRLARDLTVIP